MLKGRWPTTKRLVGSGAHLVGSREYVPFWVFRHRGAKTTKRGCPNEKIKRKEDIKEHFWEFFEGAKEKMALLANRHENGAFAQFLSISSLFCSMVLKVPPFVIASLRILGCCNFAAATFSFHRLAGLLCQKSGGNSHTFIFNIKRSYFRIYAVEYPECCHILRAKMIIARVYHFPRVSWRRARNYSTYIDLNFSYVSPAFCGNCGGSVGKSGRHTSIQQKSGLWEGEGLYI